MKQKVITDMSNLRSKNSQLTAKNIFIFDANKCVGCGACSVACMNENGFQSPERWRNIHSSNSARFPSLPLFYLSLACNHCDDAPCMKNCPALAYSRNEITGAIIHDAEKCIGCKYCTWVCPYDAPKYNPNKGLIEKCTFCNSRILENKKPACANLCPTGALDFSNEEFAPNNSVKTSSVEINIGAHLKSIELRSKKGPELDSSLFADTPSVNEPKAQSKITAIKEWPLVIFTLLVSGLVAIVSVDNQPTSEIDKMYLVIAGGIAALLSLLHLGKKMRAWRSILNQKNSWLSREIMSFGIFLGLLIIDAFLVDVKPVIFVAVGFILLFAIDKLYELAMWKWPLKLHSAQTLLIAITLILLISQKPILFLVIAILRIVLYFTRITLMKRRLRVWQLIRTVLLLSVIVGLFYSVDILVLIGILVLGEIIGRIEFYNDLATPETDDVLVNV